MKIHVKQGRGFNPDWIEPVTKDLKYLKYKANDPRYNETWTISDSYKYYRKEGLGSTELDKATYIKLMKEVFYELSKEIIQSRLDVKLPYRLGKVRIRKRKNNKNFTRQKLDYGTFNKTGKRVYLVNNHSNKYYFFWDWEVDDGYAIFTNKSLYRFIPTRGNDKVTGKRGLAHWIKYCSETPTVRDYDCLIKR